LVLLLIAVGDSFRAVELSDIADFGSVLFVSLDITIEVFVGESVVGTTTVSLALVTDGVDVAVIASMLVLGMLCVDSRTSGPTVVALSALLHTPKSSPSIMTPSNMAQRFAGEVGMGAATVAAGGA
jgi:hypothetical protein